MLKVELHSGIWIGILYPLKVLLVYIFQPVAYFLPRKEVRLRK